MMAGGNMSSDSQRPRVVIAGAGFGGLTATKSLAKAAVDVTLIDAQNHHCFQPLLYQVATGRLRMWHGRSARSCAINGMRT